jgi:hypothetical protein
MEHDLDLSTRRAFLRTSLLGAALSWTIPVFLERTFMTLNAQAADSSIQTMTGKIIRFSWFSNWPEEMMG